MRPELTQLLENVGCAPAPMIRPVPTERERLGQIVEYCRNLVGHIATFGISDRAHQHGRDIAKLAERELSPELAAGFAPLARLEQTLAANPRWTFADLSAHVSAIARDAVAGYRYD